jgi:dolichyl-phosphate-mannose-protein mannosyltransferase
MDRVVLTSLALLGGATRLVSLGTPRSPVFDEVHVGRFINRYWAGEYFFDVHPPLAKLLYLGVSAGLGYDPSQCSYSEPSAHAAGGNTREAGDALLHVKRGEECAMWQLRATPAVLGALLPALMFIICRRGFGLGRAAAAIAALVVTCDNLFLALARVHMNDGVYLFFVGLAVLCATQLARADIAAARGAGISWAAATGIALGAALQSKFLAAAPTVLWVAMQQFVTLVALVRTGARCTRIVAHVVQRVALLLGVPLVMHAALYTVHLRLLPRSGTGDGYMTTAFQSSLEGSPHCAATSPGSGSGSAGARATLERVAELTARQKLYNEQMAAHFPSGSNAFDSPWWSWWGLSKGVVWNVNGGGDAAVALSGNPVPWLLSSAVVSLASLAALGWVLRTVLEPDAAVPPRADPRSWLWLWVLSGYWAQLLPYAVLSRQMFLHYYATAYFFAIVLLAFAVDALAKLPRRTSACGRASTIAMRCAALAFCTATVGAFCYLWPLSVGSSLSKTGLKERIEFAHTACWRSASLLTTFTTTHPLC